MKVAYLIVFFCIYSCKLYAQQDLRDPSYIYSDDKYGQSRAYAINHLTKDPGVGVLFNGKLYKDLNLSRFYFDSSLAKYEIRTYLTRRSIKKFTEDASIKRLYVVGEYNPNREFLINHSDYRKYLK
jgi:hypothetical protein